MNCGTVSKAAFSRVVERSSFGLYQWGLLGSRASKPLKNCSNRA